MVELLSLGVPAVAETAVSDAAGSRTGGFVQGLRPTENMPNNVDYNVQLPISQVE